MKIIAICGQKGTGKDLVASLINDYLVANNIPTKKVQFGDACKAIIIQAFGLRNDREYTQLIRSVINLPNGRERTGKEIAKTIQMKLRQANPKYFTNSVEDAILEFKGYHPEQYDDAVFVLTDLRFKEELKWCKSNNVKIIKVKRDSGYYDPLVDEPEIDDWFVDEVIDNNGTEQDLKERVNHVIGRLL